MSRTNRHPREHRSNKVATYIPCPGGCGAEAYQMKTGDVHCLFGCGGWFTAQEIFVIEHEAKYNDWLDEMQTREDALGYSIQ